MKQHTPPAHIRFLAMDVDGVLTDGSIILSDDGRESKRFNIRDGLGIRAWLLLGFDAGIITGRTSPTVSHRAEELGIKHVFQGRLAKSGALDELCRQAGVEPAHIAYIGDDWIDLPVLRRVGYPIAVADADEKVRAHAAFTTSRPGGRGAVREAIEHLLSAKGLLDRAGALFDGSPRTID